MKVDRIRLSDCCHSLCFCQGDGTLGCVECGEDTTPTVWVPEYELASLRGIEDAARGLRGMVDRYGFGVAGPVAVAFKVLEQRLDKRGGE